MTTQRKTPIIKRILFLVIALSAITADASVIPVGPGAFPAPSTLITFTGLPDGTE